VAKNEDKTESVAWKQNKGPILIVQLSNGLRVIFETKVPFLTVLEIPPPLPLTHTFRVNPVVRPMLTPLITVHDHSPSWLGTSTLIKKNGSAKLVLWAKPLKSLTKRLYTNVILMPSLVLHKVFWGRRGRDRMVIGFTTTYSISVYHH
jgi:hypothetical protein